MTRLDIDADSKKGRFGWQGSLFFIYRLGKSSTYFDLYYQFIMGKIGPKLSHLLTVRAEGAVQVP